MILDVYVCADFAHEFAVPDGEEPSICPMCKADEIEFSHEVDLLEVK
jgi:predicted Zn-ribbon and HTH transcriptional regulator